MLAHGGGHRNTFLALRAVPSIPLACEAAFFDQCRRKRNEASYFAPHISRAEADDLLEKARSYRRSLLEWLHEKHEELTSDLDGPLDESPGA